MNASELKPFLDRVRSELPGYPVSIRPWVSDDDSSIRYFIDILNVPEREHSRVDDRAWKLAFETFRDEPIPFHMTTCDPATSARYFPDQVAGRHSA